MLPSTNIGDLREDVISPVGVKLKGLPCHAHAKAVVDLPNDFNEGPLSADI